MPTRLSRRAFSLSLASTALAAPFVRNAKAAAPMEMQPRLLMVHTVIPDPGSSRDAARVDR